MLLQMLVLGGIAEQRAQHLLYAQFRTELAQETAPLGELDYAGRPVVPGSPVAILRIPRLGLEQVVVDGTTSGDLLDGPGHLRDTPLPGQAGTSVVLGRASTYGAPFRHLDELRPGDEIVTRTQAGRAVYRVTDVRRAGDPVPAAPTGDQGRLTLVTAQGSGFLGALRPRDAIYVDATTSDATPPGAVGAAVPSSEPAMARDLSALPTLALALAFLVALVLAVSVARRHFRAVLVWLFATPVAIALAWATTDQVMRLLPNLM
jgi:sortase A